MANAATTLLEIFQRWNQPDTAFNVRRPDTDERIEEHLVAMRCLITIQADLDLIERTEPKFRLGPARRAFPRWVRAVVVFDQGWGNPTASAQLYDADTVLDPLESLAGILETRATPLGQQSPDRVKAALEEVRRLVGDDTGLPDELRWYILRLVEECARALADVELFGTFDLDDAITRLWVAVNAAAEQSPSKEMKERWRAFLSQTMSGAIGGAIANAAPGLVAGILTATGHGS